MHFIYTNKDGTVGTEGALPLRIRRDADGAEFLVEGVFRNDELTAFTGRWLGGAFGQAFSVADPDADLADLETDHFPGHTLIHQDFERDILDKMEKVRKAEVVRFREIKRTDKPRDYTFRAAWRDGGKSIDIDMDHAREITRDRLRKEREPLLADLDVQALRAIETDDKAKLAEVAAEKQRLRDVTKLPEIDAATAPEHLLPIGVHAQVSEGSASRDLLPGQKDRA